MVNKVERDILLGYDHQEGEFVLPHDRSLWVTVYQVKDWSGVSDDKVPFDVLQRWWPPAHIARTPSSLPLTPEQAFERGLEHLRSFIAREGHSDVPRDFQEDGYRLGIWVKNMRKAPLRIEEAVQLGALAGWRWLSSEALELLRSYAEREGHTDPPHTYVVGGGVALGNVVSAVRTQYRRGLVSREEMQRLEEIPHWHW